MTTEIASRLWRRRYRVDDRGVVESRWDGTPLRFIAWDRLAEVDADSLRSWCGERIKPRLELDKKRWLMGTIESEWSVRFPEAWRQDNARRSRRGRRTLFVYLPVLFAVSLLLNYLLPWAMGKPADLAKLGRLSFMAVVCLGANWFYYFQVKWGRRDSADA